MEWKYSGSKATVNKMGCDGCRQNTYELKITSSLSVFETCLEFTHLFIKTATTCSSCKVTQTHIDSLISF